MSDLLKEMGIDRKKDNTVTMSDLLKEMGIDRKKR